METEKLYSPLEFYLHNPREEERNGEYGVYDLYDERYQISHYNAMEHADAIELAVRRDRDGMDKTRGIAEYVPESLGDLVVSVIPNIEMHEGKFYCAADFTFSRPITPGEMGELTQWWSGQLSDGWGEGFEQREIRIGNEELYIVPWTPNDDFFIDTEREFYRRLGIEMPAVNMPPSVPELTPAQKALDEPGVYDEGIDCVDTSAYMSMLIDRVNANYTEYLNGLRDKDEITDYSAEIATISEAHYYITTRHNFHFSELDYLLKFQNPLLVVTEAFDANRDEEHSDIMWNIFHEQDALKNGRHALASDTHNEPAVPAEDALKQELFDRLDVNFQSYRYVLTTENTKTEIFDMAQDITAHYAAREYMKTAYDFKTGEVEYLLRFQDPLSLVANAAENWPGALDGLEGMDGVMADVFENKDAHGHYPKVMDAANPASKESARRSPDAEKPSVLDRIREAAKAPKEPRKDTHKQRNKSEPEL